MLRTPQRASFLNTTHLLWIYQNVAVVTRTLCGQQGVLRHILSPSIYCRRRQYESTFTAHIVAGCHIFSPTNIVVGDNICRLSRHKLSAVVRAKKWTPRRRWWWRLYHNDHYIFTHKKTLLDLVLVKVESSSYIIYLHLSCAHQRPEHTHYTY